MRRLSARVWKSSRKFSNHLRSYVYGARLVLDNVLEETGFLYVIAYSNLVANGPLEHVSARKVAICIQCPPVGACGPVRTVWATLATVSVSEIF